MKSMIALEEETSISLFRYGKEIAFLRQLILDGQWENVESYLKPAQIRSKIDFNQVLFQIRKQKYLELLETQQLDQNILVTALRDLEGLCTKEVYNSLCYLLTLENLADQPDFVNWTVQKGRLYCFENIKTCLSNIYQTQEKKRTPSNRLGKLLKDSIIYQYFIAKQTGSMTKFKFDPVSQCSEVSLLKDLVNADSQQKFNSTNLNEVKIAFYNRQTKQSQQSKFNTQYQSMDQVEDDVPEDFDESEEGEEDDDSQSDIYDNEFAQSMPANLSHSVAQQPSFKNKKQSQQLQQNMMAQSMSHNAFNQVRGQPPAMGRVNNSFVNPMNMGSSNPQQMSQIQQQMTNDKNYKSISYHKVKQSYDQVKPQEMMNQSYNNSKKSSQTRQQQQNLNYSSNFEFQRPQLPSSHNSSSIQENQNDLITSYQNQVLQAQNQQDARQGYHQRTGSKSSQNSGAISQKNTQQPQQKKREIMSKVNEYEPEHQFKQNSPNDSQQMMQQPNKFQNFIFQNDSDVDEKRMSKQQNFAVVNRSSNQPFLQSQQHPSQIRSKEQLQNPAQQEEYDEDDYEEDFNNDQQEEEEEVVSQQESVRQIQQTPFLNLQLQQSQQNHQNPIETDDNPQQIISDIEPSLDNNILNLSQRAILVDQQPIRACCFSPRGEHLALGTNSRSLKICLLPNLQDEEDDDDLSPNKPSSKVYAGIHQQKHQQQLQVIFEQQNHHDGSLYCVDWSRTSRLIASGSNDKKIKLLVCPDFDKGEHNELLEMSLEGHSAIVRTLCFNPTNDLILLSGGLVDKEIKVWDSETGKNISNLKGHKGDVYSIKMSNDGSFAFSVGKDRFIQIWDVRAKQSVHQIDGTSYSDMNDICFSSSPSIEGMNKSTSSMNVLSGLACVGHTDGSLTFWDMSMRKCLAVQNAHSNEARGVTFSVDGKYLASAGFDSQIVITDTSDLDNLVPVKTLTHDDKVVSVKWHPFLPLLLSTSADKTARVWLPQMHQ